MLDLRNWVRRSAGWAYSEVDWTELEGRRPVLNTPDLPLSLWKPEDRDRLVTWLTVGETYFWREASAFEALEHTLLPSLGPSLRAWCPGCSSGEEAYSLAFAAERAGLAAAIVGTDVSDSRLALARRGEYGPWSLRAAPDWLRAAGGSPWSIPARLRPRVEFRWGNLMDPFEGGWHLILCRNVLLYWDPREVPRLLQRLWDALLPGGILLVGAAELPLVQGGFVPQRVGDTQVFRRGAWEAGA